jgi:hypothetical protein
MWIMVRWSMSSETALLSMAWLSLMMITNTGRFMCGIGMKVGKLM